MKYVIINKKDMTYFSGFGCDDLPTWTDDKTKAWKHNKLAAKTQALFIASMKISRKSKIKEKRANK